MLSGMNGIVRCLTVKPSGEKLDNCTLAVPFLIYRLKIQRRFMDKKDEIPSTGGSGNELDPGIQELANLADKMSRTRTRT